jgi:hypothetical protein
MTHATSESTPPPNQDIWLLAQERSKTTFRLKVAENFSNQKST